MAKTVLEQLLTAQIMLALAAVGVTLTEEQGARLAGLDGPELARESEIARELLELCSRRECYEATHRWLRQEDEKRLSTGADKPPRS